MKKYMITVNGVSYEVDVEEMHAPEALSATAAPIAPAVPAAQAAPAIPTAPASPAGVSPAGVSPSGVSPSGVSPAVTEAQAAPQAPVAPASPASVSPVSGTQINAPMPGAIIKILVNIGDAVQNSQPLLLLEAMKMENEIVSPVDGKILAVHTTQGASVNTGDLLITIG